jgi:hypothetical protein
MQHRLADGSGKLGHCRLARVPDLDTLDLAAAGVERDKGRLKLNEFLQSTPSPAVCAGDDAASASILA